MLCTWICLLLFFQNGKLSHSQINILKSLVVGSSFNVACVLGVISCLSIEGKILETYQVMLWFVCTLLIKFVIFLSNLTASSDMVSLPAFSERITVTRVQTSPFGSIHLSFRPHYFQVKLLLVKYHVSFGHLPCPSYAHCPQVDKRGWIEGTPLWWL